MWVDVPYEKRIILQYNLTDYFPNNFLRLKSKSSFLHEKLISNKGFKCPHNNCLE